MTCKDCIHGNICKNEQYFDWSYDCRDFKDKSKFIELPDKFYAPYNFFYIPYNFLGEKGVCEYDVIDCDILFTVKRGSYTWEGLSKNSLRELGFYTTKKEAEKALKEHERNDL